MNTRLYCWTLRLCSLVCLRLRRRIQGERLCAIRGLMISLHIGLREIGEI